MKSEQLKTRFFAPALLLALLFQAFWSPQARAASPSEAEVLAATIAAEDFSNWVEALPNRPTQLGIYAVHPSAPLDVDYANLFESEVIKQIQSKNIVKIQSCLECRAAQVKVNGDRVVVSRGMPDVETLREMGKKAGTEAFVTFDIFRTAISLVTEATIYQVSTGDVIATEHFRVPAFELSSSAMQLMLLGGPGRLFGPVHDTGGGVAYTVNAAVMEELGFGKGGLAAGGIFGHQAGTMGYIMPVIGHRGRFGATPVTTLLSGGAGFGITDSKGGVSTRVAYDLNIGTFTVLGLEAVYLFPISGIKSGDHDTFNGFAGLHLGFSLGR